jgi:ribonuclease P protein component
MKRSLTRSERIRKKVQFDAIFKSSFRSEYNGVRIIAHANQLQFNRIGVIVKKGTKSAVIRNREKRLTKEAFRHLKPRIAAGYDFIFIITKTGSEFIDRINQLETLFCRLNLFSR